MKGIKFLIASAFIMLSTANCFAQFANSGKSSSTSSGSGISIVNDCENYSRVSLSYSTLKFTVSSKDYGSSINDTGKAYSGFQAEYQRAINITGKKLPLFLEVGGAINFNQYSAKYAEYMGYKYNENYGNDKVTDRLLSIGVPIDIAYKLNTNIGVFVEPYFGMNIKFNILAKQKDDYHEKEYSYFDKDKIDPTFKRVQVGGIVGLRAGYKFIDMNFGYFFDSPIWSDSDNDFKCNMKTSGIVLGLGFNF